MNALYRVVSLLLLGTVAALSCGKPTSGSGNSNTNWLHGCTGSGECGLLECLCGRCTVACSRTADCSEFGGDAVCASGSNLESSCGERTVCMRTRDRQVDASTPVDGSTGAEGAAPPPDGPDDASLESGARTRIDSGVDGRVPQPDFEDGSVVGIDTVYGCAAIRHRPGASFQTTIDVLPSLPPPLADAPHNWIAVSASGVIVGLRAVDVVRLPGTPSTESFLLNRPFLWTEDGVRDVVMPDGFYTTESWTPNCDASVLVGGTHEAAVVSEAVVFSNFRASKWSESGGLEQLPPADDAQLDPAYWANATFVDAAGSTILGNRWHWAGASGVDERVATRWVGDGRAIEAELGAGNVNHGVSADGRVVVGSSGLVGVDSDLLVWTESVPLTTVHLERVSLDASSITADGSAVYGTGTGCYLPDWECTGIGSELIRAVHAFVWTRAEGPRRWPGFSGIAAVSAAGAVIAGTADDGAAAVWDAAHGVRKLVDVLAAYGVSIPSEWGDLYLEGMSQDARIFAGRVRRQGETGEPSELFRVSLPADAFR